MKQWKGTSNVLANNGKNPIIIYGRRYVADSRERCIKKSKNSKTGGYNIKMQIGLIIDYKEWFFELDASVGLECFEVYTGRDTPLDVEKER